MSNKRSETKPNILGGIALILFIATIIYLSIVMGVNDRMETDLRNARLESEMLLSEKLQEQKKRAALQTDFKGLEDRYYRTNDQLEIAHQLLLQRDAAIKEKQREVMSLHSKKGNEQLTSVVQRAKADSARFSEEAFFLRQKVAEAQAALEKAKVSQAEVEAELSRLKSLSLQQVFIESQKRNERLTVRAKRTKRIEVSIEVANDVKDLALEIIDPSGNLLPVSKENLSISIDKQVLSLNGKHHVKLIYTSKSSLAAGVYRLFVRSGGEFMGSFRLRLE